jgi:PAS domain S-box-containing protein
VQQHPPNQTSASDLPVLLDQLLIGFAELNREGRVLSGNERFYALLERTNEPATPWGLLDAIEPVDAKEVEAALQQLDGGGTFTSDVRALTPDGRTLWVQLTATHARPFDSAKPASIAVAITDISHRKRAEARVVESQRRFRDVADAAPVLIWTSGTDRQRRHTWVNARWTEFRGRPMEAELGGAWTSGLHPEDAAECLAAYTLACEERAPFTAEYRLRRSDGEYRWLLDTGAPIRDEEGRFVGYVGSSMDITQRKDAEREREALLAAEHAARTEAERANALKDEFLGILSHELRTPLNAVLGWVHLMKTSTPSADQLARGLTVIERNARLQSRMVEDLLDMSGVMAGKVRIEKRRVPLTRIVDAVVESVQPAFAEKSVALRRMTSEDTLEVEGDPNRLHQIIWNLLSNALKFTPAGGQVSIDVQLTQDRQIKIVVTDNGPGIAADFLPFVWDRFRQGDQSTRRSHGGLGIGLALVKSLAELHGGRVSAASEGPGKGATFSVALPSAPAVHPRAIPEYRVAIADSYGATP